MFFKALILVVIYILGGILLEKGFGFTSFVLFSFYGFVMGGFSVSVLAYDEGRGI